MNLNFLKINNIEFKQAMIEAEERFRWTLIYAFLFCTYSIFRVYDESFTFGLKNPGVLGLCLSLTISFSLGLKLVKENARLKYKSFFDFEIGLITALMGVVSYFLLKNESESSIAFQFIILFVVIHLFVSLAPFLNSFKIRNNEFWHFNYRLLEGLSLAVRYSVIIAGGLCIAIALIFYLFEIKSYEKSFAYVSVFVFTVFQTWYFLTTVIKNVDQVKEVDKSDYVFKLSRFVLVPIISSYLVILYLYMFKVIITGTKVYSSIGWLISVISILGVLTLMLVYPLKGTGKNPWIDRTWKIFFVGIIPLLVMLFSVLFNRVHSYGLTESRYVVILSGFILLGFSIYFTLSKIIDLRVVPFSLLVFGLITGFGPLKAPSLSAWSQMKRGSGIIAKYENSIQKLESMNEVDRKELNAVFNYLSINHPKKLKNFVKNEFDWKGSGSDHDETGTSQAEILRNKLNIVNSKVEFVRRYYNFTSLIDSDFASIDTRGMIAPFYIGVNDGNISSIRINKNKKITLNMLKSTINVTLEESSAKVSEQKLNLDSLYSRINENRSKWEGLNENSNIHIPADYKKIEFKLGLEQYHLYFTQINVLENKEHKKHNEVQFKITSVQGYILKVN